MRSLKMAELEIDIQTIDLDLRSKLFITLAIFGDIFTYFNCILQYIYYLISSFRVNSRFY